jgi:hypothetical protein
MDQSERTYLIAVSPILAGRLYRVEAENDDGVLNASPPLENLEDSLARQERTRGGWMLMF